MSNKIIIYSHGFGVGKDDRGLFSDIAKVLPNEEHFMFDYNTIDTKNNTLLVSSLRTQTKKLIEVYRSVRKNNPKATVDLIAHSQGCVVAALSLLKFRKSIFLAPPDSLNAERMIKVFDRPDAKLDFNGVSRIPRKDSSTTLIPSDYWSSIRSLNLIKAFDLFSQNTELVVIKADDDEIVEMTNFTKLDDRIKFDHLKADHNFTGKSRNQLLDMIKKELGIA
ncbi:hypothetical protein M1145_00230 [Patescibacteria group bacterium]|nr:hypothetical protein [Patescibacteria group bacterium]